MLTRTYQTDFLEMEINEEAGIADIKNYLENLNGNKKVKVIIKSGELNREDLSEFNWGAKEVWHEDLDREMKVTEAREIPFEEIIEGLKGEVLIKIKLVNDHTAENFVLDQMTKEEFISKADRITKGNSSFADRYNIHNELQRKGFEELAEKFMVDYNDGKDATYRILFEIQDALFEGGDK